jgi:predicted nuclease with TOPRIM domain
MFRKLLPVFLLLAGCGLISSVALAQTVVSPPAGVTVEVLENRIQEIEASSELGEANRTAILDYYRKAISLVEQRRTYEDSTAGFVKAREAAPKESAALRKQLEKLETKTPEQPLESLLRQELPVLQQQLLADKADLTGLRTRLTELEAALANQTQRSQLARERLNEARLNRSEIADELQAPVPAGQPPRLTEARRWALELEASAPRCRDRDA